MSRSTAVAASPWSSTRVDTRASIAPSAKRSIMTSASRRVGSCASTIFFPYLRSSRSVASARAVAEPRAHRGGEVLQLLRHVVHRGEGDEEPQHLVRALEDPVDAAVAQRAL